MRSLTAVTEPGRRLVAVAEAVAQDFATRAARHDRDGTYPFESFEALRAASYFAAPIPESLGGRGVTSMHDLVVASSRLARGDASVAIGVNMHLSAVTNVVRRWQMAVAAGNERRAAAFGSYLEGVARDGVVLAAAISEPGQDLARPVTRAERTSTGWRLNGKKIFCTMSPAATILYASATFVDEDGVERYGYAQVPVDTPGVVVHGDWDAMGMRASGSHSISFEDVELPAAALRGGFRTGELVPYLERNLTAGLLHASSSLGIAEVAVEHGLERASRRNGSLDSHSRVLAAEATIESDPRACRDARRRALRRQPDRGRVGREADSAVRGDAGCEDVSECHGDPNRRPRALAFRWRRLREREPARPRVP
jgi:alkylation response protein AidB-like acyl-CoA dehydrogenase